MNRMTLTDGRGQMDWNADLEWGSPVLRFTPAARPIDLLDQEVVVDRPTPIVQAIDALEMSDDVGRYLPTSFEAAPVPEIDAYLPQAGRFDLQSDAGPGVTLFDPVVDEFLIYPRPGDFDVHGPLGPRSSELQPSAGGSDDVMLSLTTHPEGWADAFTAYPHGDASALPLAAGMDAFGADGVEETFGGGDDPLWMLTLLPSPDDHIHDTGFGHPGLGIDPWG